jgi:hypothetical protein
MKKEKVFIVITHKKQLRKGSHPGKGNKANLQWEIAENIEFVSNLKERHRSMGSAIGDYINRKMLTGERHGMGDYVVFEEYVRKKYEAQMKELDTLYENDRIEEEVRPVMITDRFGNTREKTVFDV